MYIPAVSHYLIGRNVNHKNSQVTNVTPIEFIAPAFGQILYMSLHSFVDSRAGIPAASFLIESADQMRRYLR